MNFVKSHLRRATSVSYHFGKEATSSEAAFNIFLIASISRESREMRILISLIFFEFRRAYYSTRCVPMNINPTDFF